MVLVLHLNVLYGFYLAQHSQIDFV